MFTHACHVNLSQTLKYAPASRIRDQTSLPSEVIEIDVQCQGPPEEVLQPRVLLTQAHHVGEDVRAVQDLGLSRVAQEAVPPVPYSLAEFIRDVVVLSLQ